MKLFKIFARVKEQIVGSGLTRFLGSSGKRFENGFYDAQSLLVLKTSRMYFLTKYEYNLLKLANIGMDNLDLL